jgi:hypothetical protein
MKLHESFEKTLILRTLESCSVIVLCAKNMISRMGTHPDNRFITQLLEPNVAVGWLLLLLCTWKLPR